MADTDFEVAGKRSVLISMSERYGMEAVAFEATLRATVVPKDTSREQFAAFLLVAKEYGLNPLTKEIYAFPTRGGGIQPIVGVDGWVHLINSHVQCDGIEFDDIPDENGNLSAITCRIYRKDRSRPTPATEYMAECKRPTDTWKQWPRRMLRHKALIQAARYAFGFSGIIDPDEWERSSENPNNRNADRSGLDPDRVIPPRPTLEQFTPSPQLSEKAAAEKRAAEDAPKDFSVFDEVGVEVMSNLGPKEFLERYHTAIAKFMESGLDLKAFDTIVENNAENVARVKELGKFSEGLGYLESDIGMIRVRLQPKTEPKPTPESEKSEPAADAQPVQDAGEDIPSDDEPPQDEIASHAAPTVPETFTFIAANNQPYNYPTIEKWEHAVRAWCLKTGTRENRMAGKKRNQEAITLYAALGGTYAEAVDRIVLALEAE